MNITNGMRSTLAIALVAAFCAALGGLFIWTIPDPNKDLITFMLGQLSGAVGVALAFYFGTTQASTTKDATIQQLTSSQ